MDQSKRSLLKKIGAAGCLGTVPASVSAESSVSVDPDSVIEKEQIQHRMAVSHLRDSVDAEPVKAMLEALWKAGYSVKTQSLEGYQVSTPVGEHISLELKLRPYDSPLSICYKNNNYTITAAVPGEEELNSYISSNIIIDEFENDVVSTEGWLSWAQENESANIQSNDCSVVDLQDLCPYIGALGLLGSATIYFYGGPVGAYATVAVADFVSAGCVFNGIYEDFNECEVDKLRVYLDYPCYTNFGIVTCSPTPNIKVRPVC